MSRNKAKRRYEDLSDKALADITAIALDQFKHERRRAESSKAAKAARKAAPKDAPSLRGRGRGKARAAELVAHKDEAYAEARRILQILQYERKVREAKRGR